MPESTVKHGYHVIDASDVTAKKVTVTPSVQPVRGLGSVQPESNTGGGKHRIKECCVEVVGSGLVIDLPAWASVGDIVYWTSYEA